MQPSLTISDRPGDGPGWQRLAHDVAQAIPVDEIDGVWTFRPFRRDQAEFGTAVISRIDQDRRRIYTARYTHIIKGRERGMFESHLVEVGSGPVETLDELMALVPRRSEEESPDPVALDLWFPPGEEEPPAD